MYLSSVPPYEQPQGGPHPPRDDEVEHDAHGQESDESCGAEDAQLPHAAQALGGERAFEGLGGRVHTGRQVTSAAAG